MLPCLDEAETVGATVTKALRGLAQAGLHGEVLVVDNGSADDSAEIARRAGARVVAEPIRGYGAAYLRGFAEAAHDVVVMADADDTYDLEDVGSVVAPIAAGADLVIANRFADVAEGAMPWLHRYVGTPAISWLLRTAYSVQVTDGQSGYRAVTRDALNRMQLRSTGMELASEMIIKAANLALRVEEIPTRYAVRRGQSKLRTFRDGWRHLRLALILTPTLLYLIPGVALTTAGVLTFAVAFALAGTVEIGGLRWQPIFAGPIFTVLGVNALGMGVVAHDRLASRGMIRGRRWLGWTRAVVGLEIVLGVAAVAVAAGLAIDAFIFIQWIAGGPAHPLAPQLAALAQSLIIVGANVGFIGFLGASGDA